MNQTTHATGCPQLVGETKFLLSCKLGVDKHGQNRYGTIGILVSPESGAALPAVLALLGKDALQPGKIITDDFGTYFIVVDGEQMKVSVSRVTGNTIDADGLHHKYREGFHQPIDLCNGRTLTDHISWFLLEFADIFYDEAPETEISDAGREAIAHKPSPSSLPNVSNGESVWKKLWPF